MVHLIIGKTLQGDAVGGVFLHLQQIVHRAPAAVVGRRSRGYIAVVAGQAQVQVVAPEPDAHLRVIQIGKGQPFVRSDLAAQPDEGLLGHLHQTPSVHGGSSLRIKAALGADEGIHQQRIEVVGLGPLVHKGFVFARIEHPFGAVPGTGQHHQCKKHRQNQQDQTTDALFLAAAGLFGTDCAAHTGRFRVILRGSVLSFLVLFVQSRSPAPPSIRSFSHSFSASACRWARSASLCRT